MRSPGMSIYKRPITRLVQHEILKNGCTDICWALTYMCNMKCSYCFGQSPVNKNLFSSWKELKNAADCIIDIQRHLYSFYFTGGEATLHPELPRLLFYLHANLGKRVDSIQILSNGSRPVKYFSELADFFGHKLYYFFSFHTESADIGHFAELVSSLSRKCNVLVRLMANPEKMELVIDAQQKLCDLRKSYPFALDIAPITCPPFYDEPVFEYTDTDFAWAQEALEQFVQIEKESGIPAETQLYRYGDLCWTVRENGKEQDVFSHSDERSLLDGGFMNLQGLWCGMGTERICIEPDGTYRGAQCRNARSRRSWRSLFNGDSRQLKDFPYLSLCKYPRCDFNPDMLIPKHQDFSEAQQHIDAFRCWEDIPSLNTRELAAMSHLAAIEPLWTPVARVSPASMLVAVESALLPSTIEHYRKSISGERIPDILLLDWHGEPRPDIDAMMDAQKICILPAMHARLLRRQLCLYAEASGDRDAAAVLRDAAQRLQDMGISNYVVDAASLPGLWRLEAEPEFVRRRAREMAIVYDAYADPGSKATFLRAIKCVETGMPGFLQGSFTRLVRESSPVRDGKQAGAEALFNAGDAVVDTEDGGVQRVKTALDRMQHEKTELRITMYCDLEHCLDIPLLLLRKAPDYALALENHASLGDGFVLRVRPAEYGEDAATAACRGREASHHAL